MKSTFFKSTLILLIGGFFTKLIGLLVKITYTRIIGTDGLICFNCSHLFPFNYFS